MHHYSSLFVFGFVLFRLINPRPNYYRIIPLYYIDFVLLVLRAVLVLVLMLMLMLVLRTLLVLLAVLVLMCWGQGSVSEWPPHPRWSAPHTQGNHTLPVQYILSRPCLALPCFALLCFALPCLASPRLHDSEPSKFHLDMSTLMARILSLLPMMPMSYVCVQVGEKQKEQVYDFFVKEMLINDRGASTKV